MLRAVLGGMVALGLMGAVASAQDVDCGKAYASAMDKLRRDEQAKAPPERLAAMRRTAMRIQHACQTGHMQDPKSLFEKLDRAKD
jgi:hypothetical protein